MTAPAAAAGALAGLELCSEAAAPRGARAKLEALCDRGSLQPIGSAVRTPQVSSANAGVLAAIGAVHGRPVACYAQDPSVAGGAVGEAQAETIVRVLKLAGESGMPVVALLESAGARLQEAIGGLAAYARVLKQIVDLSGEVPQISVITGVCAGGGAYSAALTDFVVMTRDAAMFLTGPAVVRDACAEEVTVDELGGPCVHHRNGVCQLVADSEQQAIARARDLLSFLPQRRTAPPPARMHRAGPAPDPMTLLPRRRNGYYDVRDVIRALADDEHLLEIGERWGRNMVTGLVRVGGRPAGVVANQPKHIGGVIDGVASEKAAGFVELCDNYGLPLVVLVDTPGFMPGTRQEHGGVIRRGAQLVRAFAAASVPRFTVVLRKAYGGAFIAMNARHLGGTLAYAWPGAEIGIMDARTAVKLIHRREIAAALDPGSLADRLALSYANENCDAHAAARGGFIDEVIEPRETRDRLRAAIATFASPQDVQTLRAPAGSAGLGCARPGRVRAGGAEGGTHGLRLDR